MELGVRDGANGVVEVVVGDGCGVVDRDGPHWLIADSGGEGVGVVVAGGPQGPGAGHGVKVRSPARTLRIRVTGSVWRSGVMAAMAAICP